MVSRNSFAKRQRFWQKSWYGPSAEQYSSERVTYEVVFAVDFIYRVVAVVVDTSSECCARPVEEAKFLRAPTSAHVNVQGGGRCTRGRRYGRVYLVADGLGEVRRVLEAVLADVQAPSLGARVLDELLGVRGRVPGMHQAATEHDRGYVLCDDATRAVVGVGMNGGRRGGGGVHGAGTGGKTQDQATAGRETGGRRTR